VGKKAFGNALAFQAQIGDLRLENCDNLPFSLQDRVAVHGIRLPEHLMQLPFSWAQPSDWGSEGEV